MSFEAIYFVKLANFDDDFCLQMFGLIKSFFALFFQLLKCHRQSELHTHSNGSQITIVVLLRISERVRLQKAMLMLLSILQPHFRARLFCFGKYSTSFALNMNESIFGI